MTDGTAPDRFHAGEKYKSLQAVVARLGTLDALTHLYTEAHFRTLAQLDIEGAVRDRRALSFLLISLDRVKRAHDGAVSDQVLLAVASAVAESVRELDVVGRYGREQFSVMLPETNRANAGLVADRILERIADLRIRTDAGVLSVTAGVAVAGLSADDVAAADPLAAVLHRADQALRAAKDTDKRRAVVL